MAVKKWGEEAKTRSHGRGPACRVPEAIGHLSYCHLLKPFPVFSGKMEAPSPRGTGQVSRKEEATDNPSDVTSVGASKAPQ